MEGKILVVDDEDVVVKSCERILAPEGFEVDGASNGKEAIGKLSDNGYDLVITDLKMPDMDGIELIRWMRDSKPDTGVLLITGYPSQESLKDALSLNILDYLPKPFSPALLVDVTEKAMKHKMAGEVEAAPAEEYSEEMALKLDEIIGKYKSSPGGLIPVLQQAQEVIGFLPPSVQRHIAHGLRIPVSEVHGVVSFYSFFTMKPRGKYNIRICLGTACYVNAAEALIKNLSDTLGIGIGEVTEDKKFSMETVRCLGACGLAPVVVVGNDTYGSIKPVEASKILEEY